MRLKHYIILILFTILLFFPIVNSLDEKEIWNEWGRTNAGTNELTYLESYQSTTNFTVETFATDGTNYQPLINSFDLIDNTTPYIIVQSDSFLWLLDKELNVIKQHTLAWSGQPASLVISDVNNDSFNPGESYIIGHNTTVMSIIGYNKTDFITYWEYNFSSEENISFLTNGIKCSTWLAGGSERCFIKYLRYNDSNLGSQINGGLLTIIISTTTNIITYVTQDFLDLNNTIVTIPTISDMNNDAILDIGMWSDFDQNNVNGFSVFEAGTSRLLYVDNIMTTANPTDAYGFNNPIIYDLNGGQKEIFFMHSYTDTGTGGHVNLYCYNTAGASCAGFPITVSTDPDRTAGSDSAAHSNLVIAKIDSIESVCGFAQTMTTGSIGEGSDHVNVYCINGNGNYVKQITCSASWGGGGGAAACQSAGGWGTVEKRKMIMADFNNDNNDDIILNRIGWSDAVVILDIFTNSTLDPLFNFSSDDYEWGIITDIDQDNFIDVILSDTGAIKVFSSIGTNNPPTLTANYGRSFGNPLCINSTLRFRALEDTNYEQPFSEAFDRERIVSNCDIWDTIENGTFSDNAPVFDCYYNTSGTYFVDIYLQDEFNTDDFSQFRTVTVQVINGQSGITCSIISSGTDPGEDAIATAQEDQTNEAIDDTFGILFGTGAQSDKLKLIVGLAIVITMTIWAAKEGLTSGVGLLAIALVTTVLVTFLGLLTPAILLIVLMSLVLLMLFSKFISPSSGDGG